MKKILLLALLIPMLIFAQLPQNTWGDRNHQVVDYLIGGEHAPAIWTGSDTLVAGGTLNPTRWMQIGYSPYATDPYNRTIGQLNPEYFTFIISTMTPYPTHADNDSVGVGLAWFETAYDTTADRIWNGDSTNFFIDDGTYNPEDDQWRGNPFKRVATDTMDYAYPMKVLTGGYLRIWLKGWNNTDNGSILADDCIVEWKLVGEN